MHTNKPWTFLSWEAQTDAADTPSLFLKLTHQLGCWAKRYMTWVWPTHFIPSELSLWASDTVKTKCSWGTHLISYQLTTWAHLQRKKIICWDTHSISYFRSRCAIEHINTHAAGPHSYSLTSLLIGLLNNQQKYMLVIHTPDFILTHSAQHQAAKNT